MRNITVLGSTGSIGTQTLDVLRVPGGYRVIGLTGNRNVDLMERQIREFNVPYAAMEDEAAARELRSRVGGDAEILCGKQGIIEIARLAEAHTAVNALSGCAGLLPTVEAVRYGKDVALANKESLVTGGAFVMPLAREKNVTIMPIDSEHSAIYQCLEGAGGRPYRIYLTASGGPFRTYDAERLNGVTAADALKHPTWDMGAKVTVDSATLMNKGLEVIEAMWLFDVGLNQIEVAVHPQSIVHSMVEFADGSVLAQMGRPDMRLPILYALSCPNRVENPFSKLDIYGVSALTFEKPNRGLFPCLGLAESAAEIGGNMPGVLNAANEAAVNLFLEGRIGFTRIPLLIEKAMSAYTLLNETNFSLETAVYYSEWALRHVNEVLV